MKKLLLLIITLTTTLLANATSGFINICYQHDVSVGIVMSASNDEAVLGQMCFDKHKEKPEIKLNETIKSHDIYSPDCWKGKKDDLVGGEGGH